MLRIGIMFLIALICLGLMSCNQDRTSYSSPDGYDLNRPRQMKLPLELDEISGVAYYAKDTSVFAISDEKGWLYKIRLNGEKEIDRWKFTAKADFEDIVLLDSVFYILESNGVIFKVTFENDRIFSKEIPYPFESKDEYESLYYDDVRKKLIML